MNTIKGLSLFSNVGVAEAYLEDMGVQIVVANELIKERAEFYQHVYPRTKMIVGDITDKKIFKKIISESKAAKVDLVMATPPCQGMSTAGKQDPNDKRNQLVDYAISAIKLLRPKYVLLENVPQQLKTKIILNGEELCIPDYIQKVLGENYSIKTSVVQAAEYGVPQIRQRSIFLMTRKDLKVQWDFLSESEKSSPITLAKAIGNLPSLDPKIQGYTLEQQLAYFPDFLKKQEKGLSVSKWHRPPVHKIRHVAIMRYTPEGMSALKNARHFPVNKDGSRTKGYPNTYKRQWWDRPAYTITTYNGAVCSHDNVHPGRPLGKDENGDMLFSDPRVLSIYELMIGMSLPKDWNIPDWAKDSLIRHSLGEGVPPLVVKKLFKKLLATALN